MKKRILAFIMTVAVVLGLFAGAQNPMPVYAEKENNLTIGKDGQSEFLLVPGQMTEVHVPVRAVKQFIWEAEFKPVLPAGTPFEILDITVYHDNGYGRTDDKHISTIDGAFVSFFIFTKETAKIGRYDFSLECKDVGRVNNSALPESEFERMLHFTGVIEEELVPAEIVIEKLKVSGDMEPGGEATVSFEVKNAGEIRATGIRLSADFGSGYLVPNYTDYTKKLGDLEQGKSQKVSLKVKVMEHVSQSVVLLPLRIQYKDIDGVEYEADDNNILYLNVDLPDPEEEKNNLGTLLIYDVKQSPAKPKAGEKVSLTFTMENTGERAYTDTKLYFKYNAGTGFEPVSAEAYQQVGIIKAGEKKSVTAQVIAGKDMAGGMNTLDMSYTYKNYNKEEMSGSTTFYVLNVQEKPAPTPTPTPTPEVKIEHGTMLIQDVKQSPSKPKPGEKVTLTFNMENTGEGNYTETKLYMDYVPGTGFEPVKAEPYQYVGTIKAGQKKSVTVQVIAGKEMEAGMNPLGVSYTYKNADKEDVSGSMSLYVLNVQKSEEPKESEGVSRPKLMVTEFSASSEEVKSGEEFDFTFDVFNTHSETAAKNIKVTVTSEMFSVTRGSNSFFIQRIAPEEGEQITINLKASAAAMTGSYPINIQMEYEYDGMPAAEANAGGVEVTETKMLLIKENLRVSVENVMVGGWNTPYVNQTTQLSFSIYNMGKSALNNVYFTVEGDFTVANGSSYYYGTLQSGYPDYVEMDIMPLVAGDATGTLTIHMEDSNADEVTYTADISGYIMEMGGDVWFEDPGFVDPGFDIPTDVPPMDKEVKPIVSLPIFIGVLVIVFLTALFVTRGIRIACYKKKLRKEDE